MGVVKTLFLFISFFVLLSCSFVTEGNKDMDSKELPYIIQIDYEHYIYKNNREFLKATISKAQFFDKKNSIECDKIFAEVYSSKNETKVRIKADKSIVDKDKRSLFFTGNVEIDLLEQESKVTADNLELNYEKNVLTCKDNVLVTKDNGSYLKSDFFQSKLDESETNFEKLELQYFYDEDTGKPVSKEDSTKFITDKGLSTKDDKEKEKKDIPIEIFKEKDNDLLDIIELDSKEKFELGIFEESEK